MSDHPHADKRRRSAIDRVVDRFDSTHLADTVRDRLYYGNGPLLQIAESMERAYGVEADYQTMSTDARHAAFQAGEQLKDALQYEAEAQVLAVVEQVADDEIPLERYPEEPGASAMREAVEIMENGALPSAEEA